MSDQPDRVSSNSSIVRNAASYSCQTDFDQMNRMDYVMGSTAAFGSNYPVQPEKIRHYSIGSIYWFLGNLSIDYQVRNGVSHYIGTSTWLLNSIRPSTSGNSVSVSQTMQSRHSNHKHQVHRSLGILLRCQLPNASCAARFYITALTSTKYTGLWGSC